MGRVKTWGRGRALWFHTGQCPVPVHNASLRWVPIHQSHRELGCRRIHNFPCCFALDWHFPVFWGVPCVLYSPLSSLFAVEETQECRKPFCATNQKIVNVCGGLALSCLAVDKFARGTCKVPAYGNSEEEKSSCTLWEEQWKNFSRNISVVKALLSILKFRGGTHTAVSLLWQTQRF